MDFKKINPNVAIIVACIIAIVFVTGLIIQSIVSKRELPPRTQDTNNSVSSQANQSTNVNNSQPLPEEPSSKPIPIVIPGK